MNISVHPQKKQPRIAYQLQCISPMGKCTPFFFYDRVNAFAKANAVSKTAQYDKVYIVEHDPLNSADKGRIFYVKGKKA